MDVTLQVMVESVKAQSVLQPAVHAGQFDTGDVREALPRITEAPSPNNRMGFVHVIGVPEAEFATLKADLEREWREVPEGAPADWMKMGPEDTDYVHRKRLICLDLGAARLDALRRDREITITHSELLGLAIDQKTSQSLAA